jgi:5'-3' exonuclease
MNAKNLRPTRSSNAATQNSTETLCISNTIHFNYLLQHLPLSVTVIMGIKGLWRLLLPIGRRISIETLEGQTLAIDASIWLTQFLKAMRDPETGRVQPAAHLKGFFRRICRLRYHKIKPIFVFDGRMPEAKQRELAARRKRREQFATVSQASLQRLAKKLLQEKLLKQQLASKQKTRGVASSFNPGEQEPEGLLAQNESDEVMDSKPAVIETTRSAIDLTNSYENDEDELVNGQLEDSDLGNDWDAPIENSEQAEPINDDDDWEYFPENQGSNDIIDMSILDSLPPAERGKAILQAQRRQRMQSRREFMPAAADPLQFSQVQLSNFVKMIKLNKSIATTMKAVIEKEREHGPVLTNRVELIRETSSKTVHRNSEDTDTDTDDDVEWESSVPRKTVIDDSSSSEEEHQKPTPTRQLHIALARSAAIKTRRSTQPIINVDSDSDINKGESDDDNGSEPKVRLPRTTVSASARGSEKRSELHVDFFTTTRFDGDCFEEGGFLKATPKQGDVAVQMNLDGDSNTRQASNLPTIEKTDDHCASSDIVEDEMDSVNWEEGDELGEGFYTKTMSGETASSLPTDLPLESDNFFLDQNRDEDDPNNQRENTTYADEASDFDSPVMNASTSFATNTALVEAQATASNLADWAGRVFRRAVKEAQHTASSDAPLLHINSSYEENSSRDISSDQSSVKKTKELVAHHTVQVFDACSSESKDAEEPLISRIDAASLYTEDNAIAWDDERKKRERDMDTVTDEMKDEVIELLKLFGVPYLEAPTEAEAQCAELERLGLCDGIVTEDSDAFVFPGARHVYKNIFDELKYAEVYALADAEREMSLGHEKMVALAMLLGGDYTEGVKGVGIVNAMEILEAFFDNYTLAKDGLTKFKEWLDGFDLPELNLPTQQTETMSASKIGLFHAKHKNARSRWTAPDGFPADHVLQAYFHPVCSCRAHGCMKASASNFFSCE